MAARNSDDEGVSRRISVATRNFDGNSRGQSQWRQGGLEADLSGGEKLWRGRRTGRWTTMKARANGRCGGEVGDRVGVWWVGREEEGEQWICEFLIFFKLEKRKGDLGFVGFFF